MLERILEKEGIKKRYGYKYAYHLYSYTSRNGNDRPEIVEISIFETEGDGNILKADEIVKYVELLKFHIFSETIDGVSQRKPIWQLPKEIQKNFYNEIISDYLNNDGKGAIEILDKFNPWVLGD